MYYSVIEIGADMNLQLMSLRKAAGYKSRKAIAEALGISERKYKSWETEEVRLTLEDACDIADLLDCSLDELAGRDFQPEAYSDPFQKELNAAYARCGPQGKQSLLMSARGLAELEKKPGRSVHEAEREEGVA